MRGRDASRLGALINRGEEENLRNPENSIPMPGLDAEGEEEVWNASGAMTLNDYQRLRKGYERGINPEALERMEESRNEADLPPASSFEPVPLRIEPEVVWEPEAVEPERSARRRGIGPIALTAILLVGIFGALILYAGGVAYITGLFTGEEEIVEENPTLVTERPQDQEEVDPVGALTPGEEMELADAAAEEEGAEEEAERRKKEEEEALKDKEKAEALRKEKEKEAAALKAKEEKASKKQEPVAAEKPERVAVKSTVEEPKEGADRTTVLTAKPETKSEPAKSAPTTGRYTVQVGATPDRSEADRIASRIRSKGGSGVQVITTEKNGETLYRVRFGTFGSQEEAKSKAGEMGFGDVWVVKK